MSLSLQRVLPGSKNCHWPAFVKVNLTVQQSCYETRCARRNSCWIRNPQNTRQSQRKFMQLGENTADWEKTDRKRESKREGDWRLACWGAAATRWHSISCVCLTLSYGREIPSADVRRGHVCECVCASTCEPGRVCGNLDGASGCSASVASLQVAGELTALETVVATAGAEAVPALTYK